mmetsp:Transcript_11426/g.21810  ORF Transcript_11426/g.21810 Transcript_11426/m.21810 type:complete len:175 (-) Transcript_11426:143-667(-)|eukprot:scaffold1171_cov177-Amphora_coffeaeformis.AAC.10
MSTEAEEITIPRNGSNVSDDDDAAAEAFTALKKKDRKKAGGVQFGSVRVRTHNMTLGDNPGGTMVGPPMTLEWNPADSTRFSNVEEFAVKYHGEPNAEDIHRPAHKLPPTLRQKIAAQDHSAGSIRRIQTEMFEIRDGRKKSSQEDPALAEMQQEVTHIRKGKGRFFQRLFKSS